MGGHVFTSVCLGFGAKASIVNNMVSLFWYVKFLNKTPVGVWSPHFWLFTPAPAQHPRQCDPTPAILTLLANESSLSRTPNHKPNANHWLTNLP